MDSEFAFFAVAQESVLHFVTIVVVVLPRRPARSMGIYLCTAGGYRRAVAVFCIERCCVVCVLVQTQALGSS